jgi:hypothetical protein
MVTVPDQEEVAVDGAEALDLNVNQASEEDMSGDPQQLAVEEVCVSRSSSLPMLYPSMLVLIGVRLN